VSLTFRLRAVIAGVVRSPTFGVRSQPAARPRPVLTRSFTGLLNQLARQLLKRAVQAPMLKKCGRLNQ